MCFDNGSSTAIGREKQRIRIGGGPVRIIAMSSDSSSSPLKMNLNEYMVTLQKPLGIRFALSIDGKIFVHAMKRGVFSSFLSLTAFQYLIFFFPLKFKSF